jgi:formate hydrogenlyase subunit 4
MFLAPFFSALILKVKAFFGGKKGPPLADQLLHPDQTVSKRLGLQHQHHLYFQAGPHGITVLRRHGPAVSPDCRPGPCFFFQRRHSFILYLLGLGRFFTIAAAMDTASPFEGMGAAREAYFPIICEATLFMILILFYILTGELRLAAYFSGSQPFGLWQAAGSPMLFVVIALFIILLTENSRVPVDDPATHLELTMIHEVMVLDHSGPDFGFIELGSFCKLFFYASIVARLIIPLNQGIWRSTSACSRRPC